MKLNEIYHSDCFEFMKQLNNDYVDISVTSPPYNLGGGIRKKNIVKYDNYNDNLPLQDYIQFIKKVIYELIRVSKYHVFFNIQELSSNKGVIAMIYNEFADYIKEVFIWAKNNAQPSVHKTMASSGYEFIFCFSKDNPKSRLFNYCNFNNHNGDYMKNVIIRNINSDKDNGGHNFAYPLWLPKFFIDNFSKENDVVLDCFMGSGTTGVACIELKRQYLGCDMSSKYIEIANKRISIIQNQMEIF